MLLEPQRALQKLIAGRYRLLSPIGRGAGSQVYRALDEKGHGRIFAVKILSPQENEDEESVQRFMREVQLVQQLQHPNIVRIYSSGRTSEGLPYQVLDYVDGGTLEQLLDAARQPLNFFRALNIIRFVARGLGHAHAQKIVHRDLKPGNVLISSSTWAVKLIDFGIGRSMRFDGRSTQQEYLGTPYYMSPEQHECGEITTASDVYSLAIMAFEMCVGRRPFEDDSWARLAYMHTQLPLPRLATPETKVPCWFEAIIHKAGAKDPAKRYADANEMVKELEERYANEMRNQGALTRAIHFIRPSGKLCTLLTEKGYSRRRLQLGFWSLLALIPLAAFLLV